MKVLHTKDYTKFKQPNNPKTVDWSIFDTVAAVVGQINDPPEGRQERLKRFAGQLELNPIIVTPDLEIIEGRKRFLIAAFLGLSIPYIVKGANIDKLPYDLIERALKTMTRHSRLFTLVKAEMEHRGYWRAKPRAKPFAKGHDPRRIKLVPENKKPRD